MKKSLFFKVILYSFLLCLTIASGFRTTYASEMGKTLFDQKCVACHTLGGGKKVGPDLKGVAERRDVEWLKGFIQSPSSYFTKNDEIALSLLKEFSIPMPDLGLNPDEVEALIAYLKESASKVATTTAKPKQYFPTLLIALGGALLLTLIAFIAGRKKVEVNS